MSLLAVLGMLAILVGAGLVYGFVMSLWYRHVEQRQKGQLPERREELRKAA